MYSQCFYLKIEVNITMRHIHINILQCHAKKSNKSTHYLFYMLVECITALETRTTIKRYSVQSCNVDLHYKKYYIIRGQQS